MQHLSRRHLLMTSTNAKMAATLCAKLLPKQGWLPWTQSVRHGSKAVTRRKKPLHFLKKKLLVVTRYIPPPRPLPLGAYPSEDQQVQEENSFVRLQKENVKKVFEDYRMIAVVQNNKCNVDSMMVLKNRLYKHGIFIKFFPMQAIQLFLNDSSYCNMAPLFVGSTGLMVSKEPKVKEMLSTLRFNPQMTLLGACVDNTLLSVQGLLQYSKLPSLTMAQGELVSGLTMLSSCTASMLQQHPAHLSALLEQYVKQQSPNGDAEPSAKAEEAT